MVADSSVKSTGSYIQYSSSPSSYSNVKECLPPLFLQGFQQIPKEIIIGLRKNLPSACFVSKCSTLCLGFFYITKLILLSKMGRKYCCLFETRFHVYFALILISPNTILISIRFLTLTFYFMFSTSLATQLIHSFILFCALFS